MEPSIVLSTLAIVVALLTAIVYVLQIAELTEKRMAQLTRWIRKRRHKQEHITPQLEEAPPQPIPQIGHPESMAENPADFVAGPLATYQRAHTLDDHDLAEQLHCSIEDLVHLRLCRLPRPDHRDQDIERIAVHVHADATALAQVLNTETGEP